MIQHTKGIVRIAKKGYSTQVLLHGYQTKQMKDAVQKPLLIPCQKLKTSVLFQKLIPLFPNSSIRPSDKAQNAGLRIFLHGRFHSVHSLQSGCPFLQSTFYHCVGCIKSLQVHTLNKLIIPALLLFGILEPKLRPLFFFHLFLLKTHVSKIPPYPPPGESMRDFIFQVYYAILNVSSVTVLPVSFALLVSGACPPTYTFTSPFT